MNIELFLRENAVPYKKYDSNDTSQTNETEELKATCVPEFGTKALLIRAKDKNEIERYLIVALPCTKKFNRKKLKNETGYHNIAFASVSEISSLAKNLRAGGIPPIGNLFEIETVCDNEVLNQKDVVFNAGSENIFYIISTKDYLSLVSPTVVSII